MVAYQYKIYYVDQQENGHARQSIEIIHIVRVFPSEEGQQGAGAGQQSDVAQNQIEAHHGGHGALQGDL